VTALLATVLAAAMITTTPVEEIYSQGETLDYTVTWMKVTGGTARMTISPTGDDNSRYRITSVAKSSGGFGRLIRIRDEIETIVDRRDFSTLRITKRLDERGDKLNEVTTIEDGVATRKRHMTRRVNVPRPILDPISVIYYFRTFELEPGKTYALTLYADLKVYTVHANVLRRETIVTPAGRFDCLVVEPEMISGGKEREERLLIWYSDDERHVPVRIRTEVKFGSVTATLRNVSSGAAGTDPPVLTK